MAQEDLPRLSPELQAAQLRLHQLRAERGILCRRATFPDCVIPAASLTASTTVPNWSLHNAQKELRQRRAAQRVGGQETSGQWPVISVPSIDAGDRPPAAEATDLEPATCDLALATPRTLTVHPTMLMAILRQNLEAPARVWLLLRLIDRDGRGWLTVEEARRQLTGQDSPLRCCGPRRLRQLLAAGEGLFWRRDAQDRLWLSGAHRIAHTLDCGKMQGFPVELPVAALLGGIQGVRAAFYAAFHSGRKDSPISRDTLAALSGVPGRTQLEYDRAAGVGRRRNMAIGERYNAERFQQRAWQRGRAAFRFIDSAGQQGRAGGEYVAWHLPNSYEGPYARRATGGRKRLNRKLVDLVNNGIPGNNGTAVERVFWPDGAAAAKGYNRGPDNDAYWRRDTPAGRRVWNVMAGQGSGSIPTCDGGERKNAS